MNVSKPKLNARMRSLRGKRRLRVFVLIGAVILTSTALGLPLQTKGPSLHDRLSGRWEGLVNERRISITFSRDGDCVVREEGPAGYLRILYGNYRPHWGKRPIALTLYALSGMKQPLHTVVRFLEPDLLEMSYTSPRWRLRAISFEPGQTLLLRRAG